MSRYWKSSFHFVALILGLVISILISGCGGGNAGSDGNGTQQNNPIPSVTSVSPVSVRAGSDDTTITITGSNFLSTSQVNWNGAILFLQTRYQDANTLTVNVSSDHFSTEGSASITVTNPAPGGGTSNATVFTISQNPVTKIPVNAYDIAWDGVNKAIYMALSGADGISGNSVQTLNPESQVLGQPVVVGSRPDLLSVSATSKFLYVALEGSPTVQRLTLPSLVPDMAIPVGATYDGSPLYAWGLEASPNADGTVAILRASPLFIPEEAGGIGIYDNGVERSSHLCGWAELYDCTGHYLYSSIQWNSDGSEMFISNFGDSGFDFYTVPVDASGFGTVTSYYGLLPSPTFAGYIHYDPTTGYIFDDTGAVVDPSTGTLVGTLPGSTISMLVTPVGSLGMVFVLSQVNDNRGTNFSLTAYDIHTLTRIASIPIRNLNGWPQHMVHWGANGIAFSTANASGSDVIGGPVYLVDCSFATGQK